MSNDSSSTTAIAIDRKLDRHHHSSSPLLLWLTAEERTRSRHHFITADGTPVSLQLPRGTVLVDGDLLGSETTGVVVKVAAKPEPVLTVTSENAIDLLRAAYHLGNRHVSLEIAPTYLRLTPDSVLERMLVQLGDLQVVAEIAPFSPQGGAYRHQH
ncbi:urease accessory protein UreE [Chamaesiphon minutus PCC 6605]|uniref:Urease accessory protein UreE n=2 Tax=Chamaesiphon TaxID=217161 RepID=K9UAZ4_CHAP6|nr:urease accessory protein UreE [Chamaesiphon minutus PCC 6605]